MLYVQSSLNNFFFKRESVTNILYLLFASILLFCEKNLYEEEGSFTSWSKKGKEKIKYYKNGILNLEKILKLK
tara:strand:- start:367 stop:585 length:219 start_codon:yes stop_codon:yes gene_type:complete